MCYSFIFIKSSGCAGVGTQYTYTTYGAICEPKHIFCSFNFPDENIMSHSMYWTHSELSLAKKSLRFMFSLHPMTARIIFSIWPVTVIMWTMIRFYFWFIFPLIQLNAKHWLVLFQILDGIIINRKKLCGIIRNLKSTLCCAVLIPLSLLLYRFLYRDSPFFDEPYNVKRKMWLLPN